MLTDLSAPDPQQCISVEESEVRQAVFFHFLLAQRAVQMACALNIVMAC